MPRDPDPLLAILSVTLALGPPKSKCAPTPHMGVLLPCRRWGGGSLPPPGARGGSLGGISPSLAPATVLFPLQV